MTKILCPSALFADLLASVLELENHLAIWLYEAGNSGFPFFSPTQTPVVVTCASPEAVMACISLAADHIF